MSRQTRVAGQRLCELPGWEEACTLALRAHLRMPAGHSFRLLNKTALKTVANLVAPASIRSVNVQMLICFTLGVEDLRHDESTARLREREKAELGNVVDLSKWKLEHEFKGSPLERGHLPWSVERSLIARGLIEGMGNIIDPQAGSESAE